MGLLFGKGSGFAQLSDHFRGGAFGRIVPVMNPNCADVPSKELTRERLSAEGLPLIDALVESGLAKNKSDARRSIEQGGAYVNNRRAESLDRKLTVRDLASETVMVLRSGKKKYALLRFGA